MAAVISSVPRDRGAFPLPARQQGDAGMRGRDAEFRVVGELLRRARAGAGRVLLVNGERGMGKSLLLREAGHQGSRQGFSLVTGVTAIRPNPVRCPRGSARSGSTSCAGPRTTPC
jgi:DNA-binding NtrC family response regulator